MIEQPPDASSENILKERLIEELRTESTQLGDPPDHGAVIERHRQTMLKAAERILGQEGQTAGRTGMSAEDVVQNVSLATYWQQRNPKSKHFGRPVNEYLTVSYLVQATKNKAKELVTKWTREARGVDNYQESADPAAARTLQEVEDSIDDELVLRKLPEHLSCLSEDERQVLEALLDPAMPQQKDIARQFSRAPSWVSGKIRSLGAKLYTCTVLDRCPRRNG